MVVPLHLPGKPGPFPTSLALGNKDPNSFPNSNVMNAKFTVNDYDIHPADLLYGNGNPNTNDSTVSKSNVPDSSKDSKVTVIPTKPIDPSIGKMDPFPEHGFATHSQIGQLGTQDHTDSNSNTISSHTIFRMYQSGEISAQELCDSLNLPVLSTARRLVFSDPGLNFAKFRSAWKADMVEKIRKEKHLESDSTFSTNFAGSSDLAGSKTKYTDSAKAIISDNSGIAKPEKVTFKGRGACGSFGRVSSDVSAIEVERQKIERQIRLMGGGGGGSGTASRQPFNPVRQRNELSYGNPMKDKDLNESSTENENVNDIDGMTKTAIRMFLNNELKQHQFVDFVVDMYSNNSSSSECQESVKKKVEVLLKKHEDNGPFSFKRMYDETKKCGEGF